MRCILCLLALCLLGVFFISHSEELNIFWPDVEQGACTVVVGPNGTAVIVDSGTLYERTPDEQIVQFLQDLERLFPDLNVKYIIATHYHQDHICWIDDIVRAGFLDPGGAVYDRGGGYATTTFSEYLKTIGPYRQTVRLGQIWDIRGAVLKCIAVGGHVLQDGSLPEPDENDASLGLLLSYKDFQLWIGGDMSAAMEDLIRKVVGDVDVYVVHHHGSISSSSPAFLAAIKPEVAICQAGENPYGPPHLATVASILKNVDTDGNPTNGTPVLILQNEAKHIIGFPSVYIADPDGEGPIPGTIHLWTNGFMYSIVLPSLREPLSFNTDGVGVGEFPEQSLPSLKECEIEVVIESAELVYNDHVGNEWVCKVSVNDESLPFPLFGLPQKVWSSRFSGTTTVTVAITVIEEDKSPDIGKAATTFTVDCAPTASVRRAWLQVLVREDKGRYAGNTALWRFCVGVEVVPLKRTP